MNTILISYDLIQPETSNDYKRLIDQIKSYSFWCKPLRSFWLIKTNDSPATVRDNLKKYIDNNDNLLVMNITGASWGSYNLDSSVTQWMKTKL